MKDQSLSVLCITAFMNYTFSIHYGSDFGVVRIVNAFERCQCSLRLHFLLRNTIKKQ